MGLTVLNDTNRCQDEIASIIPKKLWDKYFNHSLTELERHLLKAPDVSTISIDTRSISDSRKVCVLISILCHSQKN